MTNSLWATNGGIVMALTIIIAFCVAILSSLAITFMVWIGTKIKQKKLENKKLKKEIENELEIE